MKTTHKTFTLLELILVVAIVAVLAGAMIPIIQGARQRARVAKLLTETEALRTACIMYNSDTGRFATQTMGCVIPISCGLTENDGPGWDGPYISQRFTTDNNPFGGIISLSSRIITDWDLDGDGSIDKTALTPGNVILFDDIPESAALILDEELDVNMGGNWRSTGKLKYWLGPGIGFVAIYLIGGS